MLAHLHALETLGTHINVVTENARDMRERLKEALHALKTIRVSILDVFKHGFEERQRTNLARNDLPMIEAAITRLEVPSLTAPKIQVPPSKFRAIPVTDIGGGTETGLVSRRKNERDYHEVITPILTIDVPQEDDDPDDMLQKDSQV